MKKILFTLVMAFAATNLNAQLVVDSLGRVGIGIETPKAIMSIGGSGSSSSVLSLSGTTTSNKMIGIHGTNNCDRSSKSYGYYFISRNYTGDCLGGKSVARCKSIFVPQKYAIGFSGVAGYAHNAVGLFGGKDIIADTLVNFAGVYGSTGYTPNFAVYPGIYAGYFKGKVRVTNGIYATLLSPSASTSPSGQNKTTILSDRGERVTDKLSQVQALQFLRYDTMREANTSRASLDNMDTDNMSPEELDSLAETMGDIEPEHYLSPVQYGLDANQLKAVYPELVYEDNNGNVSINYVEIVPLLVQCINELKDEIAELKGTSPRKAKAQPTAIEERVSDIDVVRMDQNKPNPFSESTVITLNIPKESQSASIFIYDMSGKQVQSLPVSERGETNITVYASDLAAGMYIYTLVVDGKVVVTRRMIVSK
jgi:hypothetical protein